MAYPLRMFIPGLGYFVTARCCRATFLMRPSDETNEVLGGVLARAARLMEVEVFAFTFQSNHLHLLVRAPRGNLSKFMQFVMSNVARKVGWLVRWHGPFWERRYSAEPVLDEEALVDRLRYILSQGVKDGLVRRCRDWPGLSCLRMLVRGSRRTFLWFAWSKRWASRNEQTSRDRFHPRWAEREVFGLTALPHWAALTQKQRARRVLRLVLAVEEEARIEHPQVVGRERVLAQHPHHRPARPKRSPRPPCHATDPSARRAFIEDSRAFRTSYQAASNKWRRGELTAVFPAGAFKPFLWPQAHAALASEQTNRTPD